MTCLNDIRNGATLSHIKALKVLAIRDITLLMLTTTPTVALVVV